MKIRAVAVVLAIAGLGTSVAIAKGPPPGDGPRSSSFGSSARVQVCHRTGSSETRFRLMLVSRTALEAHMRHGDLLAASGGCRTTNSAAP